MTQAAAPVVRRQIVVNAPVEKAFAVFTERFGDEAGSPSPSTSTGTAWASSSSRS